MDPISTAPSDVPILSQNFDLTLFSGENYFVANSPSVPSQTLPRLKLNLESESKLIILDNLKSISVNVICNNVDGLSSFKTSCTSGYHYFPLAGFIAKWISEKRIKPSFNWYGK